MLLSLVLYHALFIPITFGSSLLTTKDSVVNMLMKDNNSTRVQDTTRKLSNVTIITEGGSTVQSTPVTLSKQNVTALITLDNEMGKDKPIQESSSSKVKPRKGVVYHVDNSTADDLHKQLNEVTVSHHVKGETQALSPPHINATNPSVSPQSTMNVSKVQSKPSTKEVVVTTPRPKKPLVLSNEALDKMPIQNIDYKAFDMSSDKNGPVKNITPMSSSQHPGMVMPVVITILVVPMFAVLGYMALRRGREAWKNRHYKRMDFLLDGMYNE